MSDAMFSIDLDVSRALAAQQRILDGWDKVASRFVNAGKALEPMGESLSSIDKSVSNLSQKGLSSLERQITKILAVQKELKRSFVFDSANFTNLENSLSKLQVSLRSIRQDLAKDITPKFNVQSVAQFEEAITKVQTRLKNLEYLKSTMNPVDYSAFETAYNTAIIRYQQALEKMRSSSQALLAQSGKDWDLILGGSQKSFSSGMMSGMTKYLDDIEKKKRDLISKYASIGSYQMMGFAGPVTGGLSSSLNTSLSAMSGFNNEAGKVGSKLQQMAINAQDAEKKLNGFGLVIKRVFEYGLVYRFQNALMSLPGTLYDAASAMDKLQASYEGIFQKNAQQELSYAYDAAQKYGKSIESLGDSYKKFAVTSEYLGMTQKDTRFIFESITQALTKVGSSSSDVQNAFRAVEQMLSKGTVSAEEFRRQFAQYIPGAMKMGADAVGKTTSEFMKMMKNGELVSLEFLPKFAQQLSEFSQGWENAANTIEANSERIGNALKRWADDKGVTGFFKAVMTSAAQAADSINITSEIEKKQRELAKLADFGILDKSTATKASVSVKDNMGEYDYTAQLKNITDALTAAENAKTKFVTDLERQFKEGAAALDYMAKTGQQGLGELTTSLQNTSAKLYELTGKVHSINVIANVDTAQLDAAMAKVDGLIKNTTYAKAELLKTQKANIETETFNLNTGIQKLEGDLQNLKDADSSERMPLIQKLEEARNKALGLSEALQDVNQGIKDNNSSRSVKQFDANDPLKGITSGTGDKDLAKQAALRDFYRDAAKNGLWSQINSENENEQRVAKENFANLYRDYKATVDKIEKRGQSSGNGAKRAAIAVDKYTESLQNMLSKEFAIANEDPLGAAFASIDEKANALSHRMEELALRTKSSLSDIPAQIAKFTDAAKQNAVSKEIEKIFPWMKKDNEVQSAWRLLTSEFEYTQKKAEEAGIPVEELFSRILKYATETAPKVQQLSNAISKMASATDFGDYFKAFTEVDTIRNSSGGEAEQQTYQEVADLYITLTKGMTESRLEMYRRVAEQAKANGMDEAQAAAYVSSKWQEAEVQRLEAIQKYGSASEAFSARLAQNFETYKDAAAKSRESAVQMADSISNMADTVSSGIGQAFGDMIRNIQNGNTKIEDMWNNMLARMLDALASFIEEAITKWTKNLLGSMFGGTNGSDPISSAVSSISNIRDTGSSTQSSSSLSSLGKSIGKGITSIFSSGDSDSQKMISALSDSSKIEKALQSASPSGYTALTSGASSGGAVATSLSSGAGMLSTIGTTLGVVGGIAGLVGMAFSLFGGEKEEVKKTASGYNVGVAGGRTGIYNVDFYSDGSVMNAGTTNPDIAKKVSDAFKDTAESLHDFAKELNFAVDVLDDFNFPSMNVTDDQLDGYIRNGQNAMAFLGLEKAGLRGAFDFVAEDYEVYVDEFERLSTAISTAGGSLSAYGYDLYTLAGLNAEKVAEIRAKTVEVAAGTADAYAAMATSMGASAEAVEYLRSAAGDGSQALSVTDEQLETILEADWASKVIDKVGGEDAFSSIMENLYKNVFDSVEKYANNLEFYTQKANKYIGKLGDSTVTIDNFWQKFDEALKGYLSPEEFEQWADASSWVNQIDTVNDLVEEWNNSMTKFAQSLDARMQAAEGLDYQSELTQQLASAEWELYEARKAGYDAALIARLQEVQAAELVATKRKHNEEYLEELRDARERLYNATGNDQGLIDLQMEKNNSELMELSKTYNWSPGSSEEKLFQVLQQAQAAELYNMMVEVADRIVDAIASLNLDSREASAAGNSDLAGALDLVSKFTKEYETAIKSNVDEATLERLQKVQQAELANYWAEVNGSIIKVNETLEDIRDALLETFNTFIESQIDALQSALDNAQTLASAYRSAQTAIKDTLTTWATDEDPSRNAQETFLNNQTVFDELYKKAMAGDEVAFGKLSSAAGSYRDSAQAYYGDKNQYGEFFAGLRIKMNTAEGKAGTLADEQDNFAKLYQIQVDLYTLLKEELGKDDPNVKMLQAVEDAIGLTNTAIKDGNTNTSILQGLTSNGNGGYARIVDAITGESSRPNTYLRNIEASQTTLNNLMGKFLNVQQKTALQAEVQSAQSQYLNYYNNAKTAFQNSSYGQFIQAGANTSFGWEKTIADLNSTGYSWSNGARAIDAMLANGSTPSQYTNTLLGIGYGTGSYYVDWDTAMQRWMLPSYYGSLPGSAGTNYSSYLTSYAKYQQLLAQLQALGGYADGGISSGAQLAWVSEGTYSNEAHVPLPDGRTIPVTITNSGDAESTSLLAEIRAELEDMRQQQRAIGAEVIKSSNITAKILTEWKAIGMPTTQESN